MGASRDFRPSEAAKARVADLIAREKESGLTPDETSELDHYMQLEHIMRLAKARARKRPPEGPDERYISVTEE